MNYLYVCISIQETNDVWDYSYFRLCRNSSKLTLLFVFFKLIVKLSYDLYQDFGTLPKQNERDNISYHESFFEAVEISLAYM